MTTQRKTDRRAALGAAACFWLGLCAPAMAQPQVFPTIVWPVSPPFQEESRNNLSGATCTRTQGQRGQVCLGVNDKTAFGQLFSTTLDEAIRTGPVVGLTSDHKATGNHMEGASHDARFFYVVTSRGKLTFPPVQADTNFLILRFSTDLGTPPLPPVPPGFEVSQRLRSALAAGIAIPQIAGQSLTLTNADIGGIAVKDNVVHIGFRAPVIGGKAVIVSVPLAAVFGTAAFTPTVRAVALGVDQGVRDLEIASDGILILSGPRTDVAGRPSVFHLNDMTGQLKPVAQITDFVEPFDRKGDGLMLVEENPEFYRVLVLYAGLPNGSPTEYFVPR